MANFEGAARIQSSSVSVPKCTTNAASSAVGVDSGQCSRKALNRIDEAYAALQNTGRLERVAPSHDLGELSQAVNLVDVAPGSSNRITARCNRNVVSSGQHQGCALRVTRSRDINTDGTHPTDTFNPSTTST